MFVENEIDARGTDSRPTSPLALQTLAYLRKETTEAIQNFGTESKYTRSISIGMNVYRL